MENISKRKAKLALITLGSVVAIGSPIIIMGSIYGFNEASTSTQQSNLNKFYDEMAGSLFSPINFAISQPTPTSDGKFLVENVITDDVRFLKIENLNNSLYDLEIIKIIPDVNDATLKFTYKISLISDSTVQITKESETYIGFFDSFQKFHNFSK
ncbi:MAG: hypothetical protein ACRC9F_00650 [Metamycoplasmataceae bacterium]